MTKPTYRKFQLLLVLLTVAVLFFSLYLQYFLGLTPCPLCLMQRFCVIVLLCLLGLSLNTLKRAHIVSFIQFLVATAGLFFSLRQVWLQSLSAEHLPACMPGLDVLMRYFSFKQTLHALFWGAGDCAEVLWSFWGLSLPVWTALYFLFMALMSLFLCLHTRSLDA